MIRILGTVFAGLLGLAFGSFLNVCLSRWPQGESVVKPRSHCRNCDHTLAWWENVPLVSWLALRGRCRKCRADISWRYPLVELWVGVLWGKVAWDSLGTFLFPSPPQLDVGMGDALAKMTFYWLLVALAVLDAEVLWLPDWLTLPGVALGFISMTILSPLDDAWWFERPTARRAAVDDLLAIALAALIILLVRWLYKLIRHREGIGLGDAKLMAMLAAWLGLPSALLAFAVGAILGSVAALVVLVVPTARREEGEWAQTKLPLGTFLCIGGILSSLWGQPIVAAYLRWAGF